MFCADSLLRSLRSLVSFADEEVASLNMIKSAPVGPVAGGIMGCIMVLVLAVYAYRHQIHRRSHQHMSPLAAQGKATGYRSVSLRQHETNIRLKLHFMFFFFVNNYASG